MALSLEKLWSGPLALHWPVECLVDISYDEEKAGVRSSVGESVLNGVSKIGPPIFNDSVLTSGFASDKGFSVGSSAAFSGTTAASFVSMAAGFAGTSFLGSGPLRELRFVSSDWPWANKHLSLYLQLPFSRQFLHISYLRRRTTGCELYDEVLSESVEPEAATAAALVALTSLESTD